MRYLLLVLLISACSKRDESQLVSKKKARIESAQTTVLKAPEQRTYLINGHQLIAVDIQSADDAGYVDGQKCYIWRDQEFKTATLSCPSVQDPVTPDSEDRGTTDNRP